MIRKIDTWLNFSSFLPLSVYYNKRYELGCGNPLKGRTADVRTVAARIGQARRRDQRTDIADRTEPREPFGEFAQESSGRHPHGAGRFFHAGLEEQSAGVLPARRAHRH